MKLASSTLRTFTAVHTWVGLVAGFALFVAFYAGAITVFQSQVQQWAAPAFTDTGNGLEQAQHLLDAALKYHPETRENFGMVFPGDESPQPVAYWMDHAGIWQYATVANPEGSPERPFTALPELINSLHYSLGIPQVGLWLMGLVSLLYGVALVSGVVIHLPRLTRDLFALRPGRNLKRFWQDAHNVIGVLSLPFHMVFAVTGTLLCLMFVLMAAIGPLAFRGQLMTSATAAMDTAPARTAAKIDKPMTPLALWYTRSIEEAERQGVADFQPAYLKLTHAGDAHAVVEVSGHAAHALGALGAIALDATTGNVLATQLPGDRDANHAVFSAMYSLHYGDYGHVAVRWLYFLLGLAGAFLFYSGNLLWIESRRKRRQVRQGTAQIVMARATVGVCIGFCAAVSCTFVAAQLLPPLHAYWDLNVAAGEQWACYLSWALCALWAAWRAPVRAAQELLWLAAFLTLMIPVAHGLATGWWFWRSALAGHAALTAIDIGALALAFGFAWLAHATSQRGRQGDPNSVWSEHVAVH